MRLQHLSLGGLAASASATNLWVSSYAGTITSLQLSALPAGGYSINTTSVNTGCGGSASWLEKNEHCDVVYCVDEGLTTPNGSVSSFKIETSGALTPLTKHDSIPGPVASIIYNGGKALAAAHYSGSGLTSWNILSTGGLSPLQTFTFKLTAPGTNPARQDAPHPHEVLVDPTDSFIVIPDLGADLLRVFVIDPATSELTPSKSFSAPAGSGPRHGAFLVTPSNETFFFLVSELADTIASYAVTYEGLGSSKTLSFEQVFLSSAYGNNTLPATSTVAECILSPDKKYVLSSIRGDPVFNLPNFDATNSTQIPSDPLTVWTIDQKTGKLVFKQGAPAGGIQPRQFSVNKNGTLAAVGLQADARVVIVERDVASGKFGDIVAEIGVPGQITSVIWDE